MIFMHKKAIALLIAGIVIVSGTWAYFYLTADKSRMPFQPSSPSPSIHGATAFSFTSTMSIALGSLAVHYKITFVTFIFIK